MSESELQVNEVARFRLYENDGKVMFWSDYCLTTKIENREKRVDDYNKPKSRQVKKLSESFIGMFTEKEDKRQWWREPVAAITQHADFNQPNPSYDSFNQQLKEHDITMNLNLPKKVGNIYEI